MGVARSVPGVLPDGGNRYLHPAPAPGDADLRGDQGQRPDDQKPLEGGVHEHEYQIRADRLHRAHRPGSGLVQRSVLGTVLPAAGIQGGRAELGLHRGSRAAPCNAELDLFWLAVRQDRPQASDLGRHVARGDHLLSAVCLAGNGHAAWQYQLSDLDLHHLHPRLLRRDGVWPGRGVPGGIFPQQDPLHVGVGAVSHRQRLGWRIGAVRHLGFLRGHG